MAMSKVEANARAAAGPWLRPLAAGVETAQAALEPALEIGSQLVRSRRDRPSRRRALAGASLALGIVALAGALAWRNRERLAALFGRRGAFGDERNPVSARWEPAAAAAAPWQQNAAAADERTGYRPTGTVADDEPTIEVPEELVVGEPLSSAVGGTAGSSGGHDSSSAGGLGQS